MVIEKVIFTNSIRKKINEVKTKEWDLSILETKFWINKILK